MLCRLAVLLTTGGEDEAEFMLQKVALSEEMTVCVCTNATPEGARVRAPGSCRATSIDD